MGEGVINAITDNSEVLADYDVAPSFYRSFVDTTELLLRSNPGGYNRTPVTFPIAGSSDNEILIGNSTGTLTDNGLSWTTNTSATPTSVYVKASDVLSNASNYIDKEA